MDSDQIKCRPLEQFEMRPDVRLSVHATGVNVAYLENRHKRVKAVDVE